MRSKWACAGGSGPSPKPPKPPGSGGLSAGSIILIMYVLALTECRGTRFPMLKSLTLGRDQRCSVACLVPVYLVVGGIIKWKVYGAEPLSVDIIPNLDFWTALPFLVKVRRSRVLSFRVCVDVCGITMLDSPRL